MNQPRAIMQGSVVLAALLGVASAATSPASLDLAAPPGPAPGSVTAVAHVSAQQASWWAFQGVRTPSLPSVGESAWARSPLDRFIQAKLEQHQLRPAARAEPTMLLRRVYF